MFQTQNIFNKKFLFTLKYQRMTLRGFGSNILGQLGQNEDVVFTKDPVVIKEFDGKKILKIACGKMHSLVLCENNELYSWGVNDDYALGREGVDTEGVCQVEFTEQIEDISAGASHSVILTKRGHVYICGTFKSTNGVFGFSKIDKFGKKFMKLPIKGIKTIASGDNHILMIDKLGDIYSVGANESFQLGRKHRLRNKKYVLTPQAISSVYNRDENYNFAKISGGSYHSFGINNEGEAFSWGSNCNGQLGTGNLESADLKYKISMNRIKTIECGYNHTLLQTDDTKVYGCGENGQFQLADKGEVFKEFYPIDGNKYDEIKSGGDFIVLRRNNKLFCRGINVECECGQDNEIGEIKQLTEIKFTFKNIKAYECGGNFTLIYTEE